MKDLIVVCILAFVAGASAQCSCPTMKWVTCDGTPCQCTFPVGFPNSSVLQVLDCTKLIPKCFLMKAEMFRSRAGLSTRSSPSGKPVDSAILDNDGIYDPECESDGRFKAIQCNNTETCWCVNSAGVRRSDKGDKNIKCEPVETYWVRLELKHAPVTNTPSVSDLKTGLQNVFAGRYLMNTVNIKELQYDPDNRLIVADIVKAMGDRVIDLPRLSYYMEKDVKILPLFTDQSNLLTINTNGTPLKMENILVYYVDEKSPTFTMQKLTGGIIAVIVVVILILLAGLLALFFLRRREKAQYSKTQAREMDPMS